MKFLQWHPAIEHDGRPPLVFQLLEMRADSGARGDNEPRVQSIIDGVGADA